MKSISELKEEYLSLINRRLRFQQKYELVLQRERIKYAEYIYECMWDMINDGKYIYIYYGKNRILTKVFPLRYVNIPKPKIDDEYILRFIVKVESSKAERRVSIYELYDANEKLIIHSI